jgi:ribose/xylose/arabinose/galactoside ABC-type transport system permease subunit
MLNSFIRRNILYLTLVLSSIILFIAFSFSIGPIFYSFQSIMNMMNYVIVVSIVSVGMTLVMLTGGMDLSIGSNFALSGAVAAVVLSKTSNSLLGFISVFIVAGSIGLINGFMIGKLNTNPVVFTLATMIMARSLAVVVLRGGSVLVVSKAFYWLGNTYIKTRFGLIPVVIFFVVIIYILLHVILRYSRFGSNLYAVGGNIYSAKLFGIPVVKTIILTYLIMGLLVGVAAIAMVGKIRSAVPLMGIGLEFDAITIVVIGGTLEAGKGDIKGTLLALLLISILYGGIGLTTLSPNILIIIKGCILLVAVLSHTFLGKKYKIE